MNDEAPLKFLHGVDSLVDLKLETFRLWRSEELMRSLVPGQECCLKARPDGAVLDGHHRLYVLLERGEDIHLLPREVMPRQMISTKLHWIGIPPPGRLAISARPRGGDWLESELFAWRALGIDVVVSLLEPAEQSELDLAGEGDVARLYRLDFVSFPIPDRGVPSYQPGAYAVLEYLRDQLQSGKSIAIHCRQGVGRAGMIAASLLTLLGSEPDAAIQVVSDARGVQVPETEKQREWIQLLAMSHRG